jgi:hypothetical protein
MHPGNIFIEEAHRMTPNTFIRRKAIKHLILSLCLVMMASARVAAWGNEGHEITARIAAQFLNDKARQQILNLLMEDVKTYRYFYEQNKCTIALSLSDKAGGDENKLSDSNKREFLLEGLSCIATWPDPPYVKYQRKYTSNWHFVDIPVTLRPNAKPLRYSYDATRDCMLDNRSREQSGDCALFALERFRAILGNAKQSDDDYRELAAARADALKFVVHIMGDLHQPMHCVTDKNLAVKNDQGDAGGNAKIVEWLGEAQYPFGPWNLHAVWDEGIIDKTLNLSEEDKKDPAKVDEKETAYIASLPLPAKGSKELALMQAGDIFKWVNDSYNLAVDRAYGQLPAKDNAYKYTVKDPKTGKNVTKMGGYRLGMSYYQANKDIVDKQLMLGGVRLARWLNEDLGETAKK